MSTNTDKLGKSGETNTTRIPRPNLKSVPKAEPPTIPAAATESTETEAIVNPLKGVKKEKSTDTVHLKVIKDAKPAASRTQTVKLRPPNAAPSAPMTPPKPVTTTTDSIPRQEAPAVKPAPAAPVTPATKTVKLKSPITPGNMTAVKPKAAAPQDKTVKMKPIPDAATGAQKTSTKVTPPMPFEDEAQEPGALMTLLNLASVAAVATGLFFAYQSMVALGQF